MPALLTINGVDVTDATIHLPRVGVWHADLSIDQNKELMSGQATLEFGSQEFVGSFSKVGLDVGNRLKARVVGGNGAFGTLLKPKGYNGVPIRIPLQDAITDSGELGLSPESDQNLLSIQLDTWSRMQVTGGSVIVSLMKAVDGTPAWRVLPDGTLWVGFETWDEVTVPQAILIGAEPEKGRIRIASTDPTILPGEAFSYNPPGQGTVVQQVSYVKHIITPSSCESVIFYENEPEDAF